MSGRAQELALRRQALVARSDAERNAVGATFSEIERRLGFVEVGLSLARRVHRHRALLGAFTIWSVVAPAVPESTTSVSSKPVTDSEKRTRKWIVAPAVGFSWPGASVTVTCGTRSPTVNDVGLPVPATPGSSVTSACSLVPSRSGS